MTCPICKKQTLFEVRPFCSKRCADLDLARWFNGSYAVPSADPEDAEGLEEALAKADRPDTPEKPH